MTQSGTSSRETEVVIRKKIEKVLNGNNFVIFFSLCRKTKYQNNIEHYT